MMSGGSKLLKSSLSKSQVDIFDTLLKYSTELHIKTDFLDKNKQTLFQKQQISLISRNDHKVVNISKSTL